MLKNTEVYKHIAAMCGNPNPAEGCRLIVEFCKNEMVKIDPNETDAGKCTNCGAELQTYCKNCFNSKGGE
jgi:hypothetical protein